jgi:hypothetical protein
MSDPDHALGVVGDLGIACLKADRVVQRQTAERAYRRQEQQDYRKADANLGGNLNRARKGIGFITAPRS